MLMRGRCPLINMDNILTWNVRGLNSKHKQNEIRNLIRAQNTQLFSLLEIKDKAHNLGSLYLNVCPGWCFSSNISKHLGGRIVVGWNPNCFLVDILFVSSQIIHCKITNLAKNLSFQCTFVYGFNEPRDREVGNLYGGIWRL